VNNIALIALFSVFLTHSSPIFSHLNRPFREFRSFAADLSPFSYATYFAMQAIHFALAFALLHKTTTTGQSLYASSSWEHWTSCKKVLFIKL